MTDESTTSRILRLLSLLQTRRSWPGPELADRAGVSARTIRRDIDRLRELGYRIDAERGAIGGYRLDAGADLPPLLFTGDEAVALALALRSGAAGTAGGAVRGMADLSVSVLAKLEQVLPAAVRTRVQATQAAVVDPAPIHDAEVVDPESFAALALACRDSEMVRFDYTAPDAGRSARRAEPVALVPVGRLWYLLAWDTTRKDWRTFRVDRISEVFRTHVVSARRPIPAVDAAAFVLERFAVAPTRPVEATIRIEAPLPEVDARLGSYTTGLESDGDHTLWRIRDERVEILFGALAWLSWPFEIVEGDELRNFSRAFAERCSISNQQSQ
jgi:predicted DNA-binding transcriptional regulator YafY